MSKPANHAIIICHPAEKSFAHSVAGRYQQIVQKHGHRCVTRDLYRRGFNPVLSNRERLGDPEQDVLDELASLQGTDVFVLIYPIWFGAPPAMLKGYIDRVFGAGRILGSTGEDDAQSILAGKRLISFTSSGSMRAWLEEKGVLSSMRNLYDKYLADVFGLAAAHRYHFDGVAEGMPARDVRSNLLAVETAAREVMSAFAFSSGRA